VIPPGNEPFFGKLLDLTMLVIPGGQERTEDEYRSLFGKAGFRLARIVPTEAEVSVMKACRSDRTARPAAMRRHDKLERRVSICTRNPNLFIELPG